MWQIILGSSVVAAIVSSLVMMWKTSREIIVGNVTKERQKWRDKIREKGLELVRAVDEKDKKRIKELKFEFSLILNPLHNEDKGILEEFDRLVEQANNEEVLNRLRVRLSLLLKHDWDRAKEECKPFWFRIRYKKGLLPFGYWKPPREKFDDWIHKK